MSVFLGEITDSESTTPTTRAHFHRRLGFGEFREALVLGLSISDAGKRPGTVTANVVNELVPQALSG